MSRQAENTVMEARDRLILALDVESETEALALVEQLSDVVGVFKVGMQLYYSCGTTLVKKIHELGGKVFLDLKLHDIPNTVYNAAKVLARLDIAMTNVHAGGGSAMIRQAVQGLKDGAPDPPPLALAVTVLTSLDDDALQTELGISHTAKETVAKWARLSQENGCNGVVCSPQEIAIVKEACGDNFLTVTPGVRPQWAAKNDQRRITTPYDAMVQGGDYIVIGRPIRNAKNPREATVTILEEMEQGLATRRSGVCQ